MEKINIPKNNFPDSISVSPERTIKLETAKPVSETGGVDNTDINVVNNAVKTGKRISELRAELAKLEGSNPAVALENREKAIDNLSIAYADLCMQPYSIDRQRESREMVDEAWPSPRISDTNLV